MSMNRCATRSLLVNGKREAAFKPTQQTAAVDQEIVENQNPENEAENKPQQVFRQRHPLFVEKASDPNTAGRDKIVNAGPSSSRTRMVVKSMLTSSICSLPLLQHGAQTPLSELRRAQFVDTEGLLGHLLGNDVQRHQQDHQQEQADDAHPPSGGGPPRASTRRGKRGRSVRPQQPPTGSLKKTARGPSTRPPGRCPSPSKDRTTPPSSGPRRHH